MSLFVGPIDVPTHFIYDPARPLGLRWKRHFVPSTSKLLGPKCIHAHAGCATVFLFCDKCEMCVKLATETEPCCAPTVQTRTWSAAELRDKFVRKVLMEEE
ncbi:hypothetical protein HBI56_031640 [Parastagonospora nodorum]|nr:hypothetical protein HBI09_103410 [Parastagonospora nodorum]KAH4910952.1 hypothetical protein HBI80_026880 [Parastagonospora nodorum]KAH4921465.1 hypothetical protein HBH74_125020 [Parastagonospora nodorum]KAH4929726.1 hypothetical protein HBH73_194060 [Parastagonospora nodorum]KAH5010458.1 hypothetical protein HBI77_089660 [Parastagonospora nodorum]